MKFTEFKQSQEVQLTEEQEVIISYCEGSITKKDAVSQLLEFDWRDFGNKITGGAIDSRAQQNAQDAARSKARAAAGKGLSGRKRSRAMAKAGAKAGQAAIDAIPNLPSAFGGKSAMAATGPAPFKKDDGAEVDNFRDMPKVPAPKIKAAAPKKRAKVKATAANTKDYDKTVALQKKLGVTADGIMGPKTRAAMKAAGMSTSTPGPSVTQNPQYSKTGMDPVDMPKAKPNIRTDMPGGPTRINAFKSVYNKATPAQKKAMIARLRQAQAKRNAPPKPTKKKPAPKNILGGTKNLLKPDDPRGGEVIAQLPSWLGGGKIKTLPQQPDDFSGE